MIWVPGFWLEKNEAELLANRGVVKDWSNEAENTKAVTMLLQMNLHKLLKP